MAGERHRAADRRLEDEHVALEIGDAGVCLDHLGQRVALPEDGLLARTELLVQVEEAIPVPKVCELVDHDRLEQGAKIGAGDRIFGDTALERVDVIDVAVGRLQLVLDLNVAGDLREAGHGSEVPARLGPGCKTRCRYLEPSRCRER